MSTAVRLIDTGHFRCKWLLGEPSAEMMCCGAPKVRGSYCAEHAAIAYGQGTESERSAGRELLRHIEGWAKAPVGEELA